jgi:hypothetical protein
MSDRLPPAAAASTAETRVRSSGASAMISQSYRPNVRYQPIRRPPAAASISAIASERFSLLLLPQSPRFDRNTLRLRRIRWAAGADGRNLATTGFGAGENTSKNKVAGRSQKLIAAASIRTVPHGSVRQERRQRASNLRRRPSGRIRRQCLHCQVEAPGFSPGIFPRKHAEPGSSCGAGGHLAAASGPEASGR